MNKQNEPLQWDTLEGVDGAMNQKYRFLHLILHLQVASTSCLSNNPNSLHHSHTSTPNPMVYIYSYLSLSSSATFNLWVEFTPCSQE